MTGNPALDKIIFMANTAVVVGSALIVVYSHTLIKRPLVDRAGELSSLKYEARNQNERPMVKIDRVLVNLSSRKTRLRFVEIEPHIQGFSAEDEGIVREFKHIIYDSIIDIAGNLTPRELNSLTGRILLESKIREEINRRLGKKVIKKIFFSKFVVQ
jgi:flagellar FliL protein